jgi:hypothetical protein
MQEDAWLRYLWSISACLAVIYAVSTSGMAHKDQREKIRGA